MSSPTPPAWRREPPTARGWYWWLDTSRTTATPRPVLVVIVDDAPVVMACCDPDKPVAEMGGLWFRCLPPPPDLPTPEEVREAEQALSAARDGAESVAAWAEATLGGAAQNHVALARERCSAINRALSTLRRLARAAGIQE